MYEERMRSNWFGSQQNAEEFMRMQEEALDEKMRITKMKFFVFGGIFLGLYLFSEMVFSIYRTPQYVVLDKTTGKRMVVSERQLESMQKEQVRKFNHDRREHGATQNLQSEIQRIISEQDRRNPGKY